MKKFNQTMIIDGKQIYVPKGGYTTGTRTITELQEKILNILKKSNKELSAKEIGDILGIGAGNVNSIIASFPIEYTIYETDKPVKYGYMKK